MKEENAVEEAPQKRARWYIVHTYSGFEQRVQKTILEMKRNGQDEGLIEDVVVPTEKVLEPSKHGEEPRTTTRKFYPGYIMVRMVMTDLSCANAGCRCTENSGPDGGPSGNAQTQVQL